MSDDTAESLESTKSSRRVRKDHTCISLGLVGQDLQHMCDKCKFFQLRLDGISGRKPGKNAIPKCEKPWFISIGRNTPHGLIEKKRMFIKILNDYNYKVIDDTCDNNNGSRLYNRNYTTLQTNKVNTNQTESPKESNPVQLATTLKDDSVFQTETRSESVSFTEPPTKMDLDTYLATSYPRKYDRIEGIRKDWLVGGNKTRQHRTLVPIANTLQRVLQVMSAKESSYAADILRVLIERNVELNNELNIRKMTSVTDSDRIVSSIKGFVKDKLKTVKRQDEKEALSAIVQACTYQQDVSVSEQSICEAIGVRKRVYQNTISANSGERTDYIHVKRKARSESMLTIQQRKCVEEFCHSEESSSIDSNSKRMVEVKRGQEIELHVGRVWNVLTVTEQYNLFLESEILEKTKNLHPEFISPSRSFFYKNRCHCVAVPTMQSCVDIITSATQHYMRCIAKYVRTNKEIRDQLTSESWIPLLCGYVEDFVDALCCDKVQHPNLVCGIGSSKRIPSFLQWKCINNTCDECGVNKKFRMDECVVLMSNTTEIQLLEWKEIARQGVKKNGKANTQLELSRTIAPVNVAMDKLMKQLVTCIKHVGEYRWRNHMKKLDLLMSNHLHTRVICTDFGATLDLSAIEKDNSSVDNHAVICIFFVLTKWRRVPFLKIESNTMDETIVSDCDKWIILGDTISKGKKNDHVFHNACLAYIIKNGDAQRDLSGLPKIKNNIVHTDNCPTQYKCRQNFWHVASAADTVDARVIHKFASKYRFKGSWDATGKIVKSCIMKNELKMNRCANAYDCYINLRHDLSQDGNEKHKQKWLEWENNGDERILEKTELTSNRTIIGLGTEHQDEYDRLRGKGKEHIIYTNRVSVPNMETVKGTRTIFQVQGDLNSVAEGQWSLHTSSLQCSCPPCRSNPASFDECLYKDERNISTCVVSKLQTEIGGVTDPFDIAKLTVQDLKLELKGRGLLITGLKAVLKDRLLQHMIAQRENGEEVVKDDELGEKGNAHDTFQGDEPWEGEV